MPAPGSRDDSKASPPSADSATPRGPADSTTLQVIKTQKAFYPEEAREQQLQGQVIIKIHVTEEGDVDQTDVVSGEPILAKAAVEAGKKWKFKPYIRNGKPIAVSADLPFNFAFTENVHEKKLPPDSASAQDSKIVKIASGISQGLLIYRVQPVYPAEARHAYIQGKVLLLATISKEGRITDLQVVSGPKELVQAAVGAVQQWRYKPYLLAGEPVVVSTQIEVNFELRR